VFDAVLQSMEDVLLSAILDSQLQLRSWILGNSYPIPFLNRIGISSSFIIFSLKGNIGGKPYLLRV
jgi:hypothetical protein